MLTSAEAPQTWCEPGSTWSIREHGEAVSAVHAEVFGAVRSASTMVIVAGLVGYFGPQAADPVDFVERDWMAEEFSRGCYRPHFTPGVWTAYGTALGKPGGRIHWAGAECSPIWNDYIQGALRSGEHTAPEVLPGLV